MAETGSGRAIVRHNELVFEYYFTGCDEYFSGLTAEQVAFNPETKHDERSVTKATLTNRALTLS